MSVMGPDLDVVIVTYNSIHVIGDLLDSLPTALDPLICDVVVVDNGSQDGTAEFAEQYGGCRVVHSVNSGYAGGINRGVREAVSAEAILVLNPDVRLEKNSVPPLLEALREPGVGIVVPQIRTPAGALERTLRRDPTLGRALGLNWTRLPSLSEYITDPADYSSARNVDWAQGAVVLMSRKCYNAVNGWDESFFLYSEETDFCLRARDLGFLTRYEPRAVAYHVGGASGQNARTHVMQIVNRVRMHRRRYGALSSWCYYWATIASAATWLMRGHRHSWPAIVALLLPSRRPVELGCGDKLMPH
jgi:GT2 family glycosyltransferase